MRWVVQQVYALVGRRMRRRPTSPRPAPPRRGREGEDNPALPAYVSAHGLSAHQRSQSATMTVKVRDGGPNPAPRLIPLATIPPNKARPLAEGGRPQLKTGRSPDWAFWRLPTQTRPRRADCPAPQANIVRWNTPTGVRLVPLFRIAAVIAPSGRSVAHGLPFTDCPSNEQLADT